MPGTKRICEVRLNFRHFHTNSKKFFETVYFPRKNQIRLQKGQYYFFSISRSFRPTQHFRRLPKTLEDQRRAPTIDCQRCLKNPPSETENIIKLANLTANTKNFYGQITLNTKPHSDTLFTCMSEKVWKQLV